MPTTILVFLPLAVFSDSTARTIWDLLMLLCYILACALLFRALAPTRTIEIGLWALAPLYHPWRENISRGQVYPLLLVLLVVGSLLSVRQGLEPARNSRTVLVAGLAFGLIAILKFYYAAILPLPILFWRRGRTLTAAALVFAGAALVTLALWGSELWVRAIGFAVTWRDRPESGVTAYQTLNGWLTHLLRYDATYNPGPVADLPAVIGWLWWTGTAALIALTCLALYLHHRTSWVLAVAPVERLLPMALLVPLGPVLAPVAEDYHFVLVLFSLVVVGRLLWDMYAKAKSNYDALGQAVALTFAGLFLLSALLLGAAWRFNVPDVEGWKSLLYYPRLYGALLLWGLATALLVRGRRSPALRRPAYF